MDENGDFMVQGHSADGVSISGGVLTLDTENRSYLQKDWTGSAGQEEWIDATSYLSSSGLDGSDTGKLTLSKESWTPLANGPSARSEHVAVWDPVHSKMVVMGGSLGGSTGLEDAWTYSSGADLWTASANASAGRYWHSGAWDGHNNEVFIFGGMIKKGSNAKAGNDSWDLDIGTDLWKPKANATQKRYGHSAVWDPVRMRVLVFGGYADNALSNDMWSYDPISDAWEQKKAAPLGLYEHSAVWAEGLDRMLVFGGLKSGGVASKDLWSYDAGNDTWVQHGTGASPRSGHAAAWDPLNKVMIIVGGHNGQSKYNDTWIYDPLADHWRSGLAMPGVPRTGPSLVWDKANDMAILYGGEASTGNVAETWGYSPFHVSSGSLVSSAFDMNGASALKNISWKRSLTSPGCQGASLKVQLAASNEMKESGFAFSGPLGPSSYYRDGELMDTALMGKRYLRYKVEMSTTNVACAPVLDEIRINYLTSVAFGNYTSPSFDTGSSVPNLISFDYEYDNPGGTEVFVYIRSAFTEDMTDASEWEEVSSSDTLFSTPPRRFVQFQVSLFRDSLGRMPYLDSIKLRYNSVPELITSPIEPSEGDSGTGFMYKLMYRDADGDSPLVYKVYIDGKDYDMVPQDYDYAVGANFTFTTALDSGQHEFHFEFSDRSNSTRAPLSGDFEGPLVNDPPQAEVKAPKDASVGEKVRIDASSSKDPDGKIVRYKFDFGDGTDSGWINNSVVKHPYKKKGSFDIKVHVRDDLGREMVSSVTDIKISKKENPGLIPAPGGALTLVAILLVALILHSRKDI